MSIESPKRGAFPIAESDTSEKVDRAGKATSVQSPKRGAIPSPRSALAAARPYVALIGAPPNFITVPAQISFWGNYSNGDCVTAEEAFAKSCNSPEIFITEAEVIAWATANGVLNGAYLNNVLQLMQSGGFQVDNNIYDDGPYLSVDWTNAATLQSAISSGPVKIGVGGNQLDATWLNAGGTQAGGVSGWFAVGYQRETAEDHCVSLCGYGTISWLAQQLNVSVPGSIDGTQPGYALFTWDSVGIIDWPSLQAITFEAWLRQPTTVIGHPSSPYWTNSLGTIGPGESQTWWFTWGGNGDVGPQLIQAQPLGASGELATTQIAEGLDGNGNLTYYATVVNNGTTTVTFQWRGGAVTGGWTSGSGSLAPGASQDWWFTWGGNGDIGPQLIQAQPLSAGELATTQIAESLDSNGNLAYHATVVNTGTAAVNFQWRGGAVTGGWTSASGTLGPAASQDWWFTWGGNGDVGPQLIEAQPLGASGELATTQIAESNDGNGNLVYHATVVNNGTTTANFQWRGGGV